MNTTTAYLARDINEIITPNIGDVIACCYESECVITICHIQKSKRRCLDCHFHTSHYEYLCDKINCKDSDRPDNTNIIFLKQEKNDRTLTKQNS